MSLAKVTPAYGMRDVGGFGIRGWRVHCANCCYLSHVYVDNRYALTARNAHQCEQPIPPANLHTRTKLTFRTD